MWQVEMKFGDAWVLLATGYARRDDAEWAVSQWKQANDMRTDPFRYSQAPAPSHQRQADYFLGPRN